MILKFYQKYQKDFTNHFYGQFSDLNKNKLWFKNRYREENILENAQVRKSMCQIRHTRLLGLFNANLAVFEEKGLFEETELVLAGKDALFPVEGVDKSSYLRFAAQLNARTSLFETKSSYTLAEFHKKINSKVEVLNLESLFPVLSAKMIYKFLIQFDKTDSEKIVSELFSENQDAKFRIKNVERSEFRIRRIKIKDIPEMNNMLLNMRELFNKSVSSYGLSSSTFLEQLENLIPETQILLLLVYFYHVWFLDISSGNFSNNHLEFSGRNGDFVWVDFSEMSTDTEIANVNSENGIVSLANNEKLAKFMNTFFAESPLQTVKEKVTAKLLKSVSEVSTGIFMCDFCRKFFQTREYAVNHIVHRHEEQSLKYFDRYNAKFDVQGIMNDPFSGVFTRIEMMKIHYQPFSKTEEFSFYSKRVKYDDVRNKGR